MMKIKLLIFAVLLANICHSQDSLIKNDIRAYNLYINKAELVIVDSAINSAVKYYDTAFTKIRSPFAADLYNSSICDAFQSNFEKCSKKIIELLRKGMDIKEVTGNKAFEAFLKSSFGDKIRSMQIIPSYNQELRHIYDSLQAIDQYFRKLAKGSYMNEFGDTVTKIDKSNVNIMNALIKDYGWPTEDLIGIEDLYTQPYEIIIIHQNTGGPTRCYDYIQDLSKAYWDGNIEPKKAAILIMRSCGQDTLGMSVGGITTYIYDSLGTYNSNSKLDNYIHKRGFYGFSDEIMSKINKARKSFGIESLDDYRKK